MEDIFKSYKEVMVRVPEKDLVFVLDGRTVTIPKGSFKISDAASILFRCQQEVALKYEASFKLAESKRLLQPIEVKPKEKLTRERKERKALAKASEVTHKERFGDMSTFTSTENVRVLYRQNNKGECPEFLIKGLYKGYGFIGKVDKFTFTLDGSKIKELVVLEEKYTRSGTPTEDFWAQCVLYSYFIGEAFGTKDVYCRLDVFKKDDTTVRKTKEGYISRFYPDAIRYLDRIVDFFDKKEFADLDSSMGCKYCDFGRTGMGCPLVDGWSILKPK